MTKSTMKKKSLILRCYNSLVLLLIVEASKPPQVQCLAPPANAVEHKRYYPSSEEEQQRNVLLFPSRRAIISLPLIGSLTSGPPSVCFAAEEGQKLSSTAAKPYAPREALLPATRCKLWIDHAHNIASTIPSTTSKTPSHAASERETS